MISLTRKSLPHDKHKLLMEKKDKLQVNLKNKKISQSAQKTRKVSNTLSWQKHWNSSEQKGTFSLSPLKGVEGAHLDIAKGHYFTFKVRRRQECSL